MIDFGFDKIALIGAVALIVLGPSKLPRAARTIGHLLGKAQRYAADVRAEVSRSIELEDLKKMREEFTDAARGVERSVADEFKRTTEDVKASWHAADAPLGSDLHEGLLPPPQYQRPNKHWRVKRGATPQWYKQRNGVRSKALSGAARVARFRPRRTPV
ncbi:MAG: Sec-independent protein translocase protein TatB [Burkholderiaceae bacterium]|nr:Sec-independent protein translocase protein TatB [Burkholderiaceae bacterium]